MCIMGKKRRQSTKAGRLYQIKPDLINRHIDASALVCIRVKLLSTAWYNSRRKEKWEQGNNISYWRTEKSNGLFTESSIGSYRFLLSSAILLMFCSQVLVYLLWNICLTAFHLVTSVACKLAILWSRFWLLSELCFLIHSLCNALCASTVTLSW